MKRDPLLEALYSAQRFYERNRKRILTVLGLAVVLTVLILLGSAWKASSAREASGLLARGVSAYRNGEFSAAVDELDLLIAEYPNTQPGREALFYLGKAYLSLDDVTAAKELLEQHRVQGKSVFLLGACMETLAGIAESEQRYSEAARLFQRAASKADYSFSAHQNEIDAAANWIRAGDYEKASAILMRLGDIENAHTLIKDQVDEIAARLKIVSSESPQPQPASIP